MTLSNNEKKTISDFAPLKLYELDPIEFLENFERERENYVTVSLVLEFRGAEKKSMNKLSYSVDFKFSKPSR